MGLATIIRKSKIKEQQMRILVLGLDNAGKSTIVARWIGDDISEISPTFGFKIRTYSRTPYQLNLWDIGGQRSIRAYWRNYFEETDGLVFVIDSSAPHRFSDSLKELSNLLEQDRLCNASVLIMANKQDCMDALAAEKIKEIMQLEMVLNGKTNWRLFSCSAVSGNNIQEALDWLVHDVASRLFHHNIHKSIY